MGTGAAIAMKERNILMERYVVIEQEAHVSGAIHILKIYIFHQTAAGARDLTSVTIANHFLCLTSGQTRTTLCLTSDQTRTILTLHNSLVKTVMKRLRQARVPIATKCRATAAATILGAKKNKRGTDRTVIVEHSTDMLKIHIPLTFSESLDEKAYQITLPQKGTTSTEITNTNYDPVHYLPLPPLPL